MTIEEKTLKLAEHFELPKTTVCPVCHGKTPMYDGDDYGITLWRKCEYCSNTGKVPEYYPYLPNYFFNLNAVHELEKSLSHRQKEKYLDILSEEWRPDVYFAAASAVFATATERCEALGKTLELW